VATAVHVRQLDSTFPRRLGQKKLATRAHDDFSPPVRAEMLGNGEHITREPRPLLTPPLVPRQ
jgi:hypothetical protein